MRYVVARLGPYANIAGWNYVWEVPGNREDQELGWARLVKKYDVFDHLRTYQDECLDKNEFNRPEYNFAGVENHYMFSTNRDQDRKHWAEPWTHHDACLAGYVTGKPVYMVEGNALWRRYWAPKSGATQDDLRQAAWACATAGASFTWCGHHESGKLMAKGPQGLPFSDENKYTSYAKEIDILGGVMTEGVSFHSMTPQDELLSDHDKHRVWCLAESGKQYLVFSSQGKSFSLTPAAGEYTSNFWINTKTGAEESIPLITATGKKAFTPPNTNTDWVLVLRKDPKTRVGVSINSYAKTPCMVNFNTITNELAINSSREVSEIRIVAITGKLVYEFKNAASSGKTIVVPDLSSGVYIVSGRTANSTHTQKIIKR